METPVSYNAQFFLDKEKDKPTAKVRYRVKWARNTVAFSIGYRVEINKWSTDTQRCKLNTTHGTKKIPASKINHKIDKYQATCAQLFQDYNSTGISPTDNEFRIAFNEALEDRSIPNKPQPQSQTVQSLFEDFIKEESIINQWTVSTIAKMKGVQTKLAAFSLNLKLKNIDKDVLLKYQLFLQRKQFKNSTILKHFGYFKWFLRWADKKGYETNRAYKFFRPRLKSTKKKVIFLTREELTKLTKFPIPPQKQYLERVRDIFLFQCFTGLRFSDVSNLRTSDIKGDHIEVTTVKTSDSLIIELNRHSKAILEKYKDFQGKGTKALPVITNQRMNDYLKELAELAGIDEPIRETYYKGNQRIDEITPKYSLLSSHAGRRTFICNALSLGIPPQVVMKWTGHSDYKSMKPYIDVADATKSTAMKKFDLI